MKRKGIEKMTRELFEIMASDYLNENGLDDIITDGEPCFDTDFEGYVQYCHDSKADYVLIDQNGDIEMRYIGAR